MAEVRADTVADTGVELFAQGRVLRCKLCRRKHPSLPWDYDVLQPGETLTSEPVGSNFCVRVTAGAAVLAAFWGNVRVVEEQHVGRRRLSDFFLGVCSRPSG